MKKVLLASTALVLTASYAAAEVTTSGEANVGVTYVEDRADELQLHYELDFSISGSGTSDSGLAFGASFDLDLDDSADTNDISDAEVFISGSFGTFTFGSVDSASDNVGLGIADPGFDGIGVDDDSDQFIGAGSANILYEYAINDFQIAVSASAADSAAPSSDDFGVGVSYAFGDFTVAAAYEDTAADEIVYVGFSGSAGDLSYDLLFSDADTADLTTYGVSVDYTTGDITWTVAVGDDDGPASDTDFGVGVSVDLGGGLAFGAGLGSVDDLTVADAGFTMSF